MLRPFKSLQHTEVTSSHLILVLLFYFILKVILLFHQYLLNIKFCALCLFIISNKMSYSFDIHWLWIYVSSKLISTKSTENWLTSKNITLLRSNVNLLSFVVQVQGQDCAVSHEDTYWCPWSSNAVPFLLPMSHTITDSS